MSHSYASSTTATTASTAQPLSDVLPWGFPLVVDAPSSPPLDDDRRSSILRTRRRARTLLVTDGISADGRFVLHSLALQFLSSRAVRPSSSPSDSDDDRRRKSAEEGSVLWIGCGPLAESQICGGLRKGMAVRLGGIGGGERSLEREEHGETTGIGGVTTTAMGKLHVIAVPLELADASLLECNDGDAEKEEGKGDAFESNDNNDNEDDAVEEFSHERYLKGLHRRIVHWLYHRELLSVEAASAAKSTPRHPRQQQQQQSQQQQQQQQQQRDTDTTTNNTSSSYMGANLIIVDNLSVFSSLFGDVLTHAFLTNVRATLKRHAARTSGEISSVASDDAGFENRQKDDHDPNNHMSAATPANHHTNATITTMTTTNLLAVRCTSPDDGGLYHLDDDDDDVLDIGSESGRVLRTSSVKGERLRSEHARLLRPWWGMGSGCGSGSGSGSGGNGLLGGVSDGVADATPTSVAMGGTIASSHSTICHLEERSHQRSLFPSAENGGVVGPHSTSSSTSLLHKIGMYEYSDGIVDVSPLESGYARDILGRISFTTVWGGRGWWGRGDEYGGTGGSGIGIGGKEKQSQDGSGAVGEAYASICVNYRCEDGGVRVLRLRSR